MKSNTFRNIIFYTLGTIFIFFPIVKGGVEVWVTTLGEAIIITLVFLWLWRVNNSSLGENKLIRTKIDLPLGLFVILAIISAIFSIYKYASILEMLRLLTMVGVFYLVINNFNQRLDSKLTFLIIAIGTGLSLFGLGQYFLGLDHSWWKPENFLAATYVNHNHFAGYLELAIPLAIGVLVYARKSSSLSIFRAATLKTFLEISILVMILAFVFSQSRAGWVCLTISLLIMNIALVRKNILSKSTVLIFLFVIVLAVAYIYAGNDMVTKRFRTFEKIGTVGFIDGRAQIWQGTIDMIKDRPLTGTGIGTFVWGFPAYRPASLAGQRAHYAHNEYLHMASEMGILAIPLMIWMAWVVIGSGFKWKDKKIQRDEKFSLREGIVLGSAIGILSLTLHGLVDFNFHIPANMLVVSALAGIIMRKSKENTYV